MSLPLLAVGFHYSSLTPLILVFIVILAYSLHSLFQIVVNWKVFTILYTNTYFLFCEALKISTLLVMIISMVILALKNSSPMNFQGQSEGSGTFTDEELFIKQSQKGVKLETINFYSDLITLCILLICLIDVVIIGLLQIGYVLYRKVIQKKKVKVQPLEASSEVNISSLNNLNEDIDQGTDSFTEKNLKKKKRTTFVRNSILNRSRVPRNSLGKKNNPSSSSQKNKNSRESSLDMDSFNFLNSDELLEKNLRNYQ